MIATRTEYNGRPTLTLKRFEDEKYPFSFGVEKAQRILESLDEIKKFVDDHISPVPATPATPKPQKEQPSAPTAYSPTDNSDDLPF
jgi:hypothetical protein